ncbi:bifunctional adenosylcobinamide kinase/adenosylcobinamide-phosphate guanylyltransferase [Marinimicrobium alkaliphilum]|uniref:bifunctional adenosylcobinamide kinase/adenosylcobinamide-phosphate guanylyltransferase n=1 Tax=Marinimicrobium alkaliphilum TaxID=2202654 RepID=UPI000DB9954B|nr:bifunctional adenosylcobinamide kinase/adenosylcobinamide-phosphate guanylyltransferase [Marinimicrobium alkaliphilum]
MRQLILGGARSGKSRLAETRAEAWAAHRRAPLVYVATASAGDTEMTRRIAHHRARRGDAWQLLEEPEDLAGVIERYREHNACVLVDCLTLWLSNCLHAGNWDHQRERLLNAVAGLEQRDSPLGLILVSNEVGSGIVPLGQLSRDFVDASGWLHQALAPFCEQVSLVVAGLPLELKHGEKAR